MLFLTKARLYIFLSILVLAGIAALALGLPRLRIDSDVRNVAPKGHPDLVYCDQVDDTFGAADAIVVGIESPRELTTEVLSRVRRITDDLSARFDDVMSVTSAETIVARDMMLKPEPLVDEGDITDETLANLRARLEDWSIFDNLLVSGDRKALAVLVRLQRDWTTPEKEAAVDTVRKTVEAALAGAPEGVRAVYAGEPVVDKEIGSLVQSDMSRLTPLALVAVLLILLVSLRSLGGVVGPMLTVILSAVATFGLMALLDRPVMLITSAIPVFLVAVGTAYGIHLAAHFRSHMEAGKDRFRAISDTIRGTGGAVLVAATTTIAGFASLGTSSIGPVRDFGLFLAFGITVALIVSFTVVPTLLLVGGGRPRTTGPEASAGSLATLLRKTALFSVRHRWLVVGLTTALCAASIGITVALLRVDQESVGLFPDGSTVRESDELFATRFGGTHTLSVVLEGPGTRSMLDPRALTFLDGLQRHVEKHPEVGKTTSLADYIRRMNRVMHRGEAAFDVIPDDRNLVAQYVQLYEMSGDTDDFSSVVDFDYASGQVLVQIRSGRSEVATEIRSLVEEYAAAHLPEGYKTSMAGTLVRYEVINGYIVSGQLWSLLSSLVMVFLMVAVLFLRGGAHAPPSLRRALLQGTSSGAMTLLPIGLAVVVNFGLMALLDIPLDISTALIANCAVGIGIDYSVHLMHRYQAERSVGRTSADALEAAAGASGRPIVFNAVAVAVGFLTMLLSGFLPLRAMAWLTAMTMIVSATAALAILPALLFIRDRGRGTPLVPEHSSPLEP